MINLVKYNSFFTQSLLCVPEVLSIITVNIINMDLLFREHYDQKCLQKGFDTRLNLDYTKKSYKKYNCFVPTKFR